MKIFKNNKDRFYLLKEKIKFLNYFPFILKFFFKILKLLIFFILKLKKMIYIIFKENLVFI